MKFKYILSCFCLFGLIQAKAQSNGNFSQPKMFIQQYLNLVGRENVGYDAQKYEVNIAEAGIESAKVFPDPQFSAGVFDNQQAKLKLGQGITFGLSTTLELGGKRTARIAVAKSGVELNKALLLDYLRNLRADAASAYYNAILQNYLLQLQLQSYQTMKQIADADSVRFKPGSNSETDARQSRLEPSNPQNGNDPNKTGQKKPKPN